MKNRMKNQGLHPLTSEEMKQVEGGTIAVHVEYVDKNGGHFSIQEVEQDVRPQADPYYDYRSG